MSSFPISPALLDRANSACELCFSKEHTRAFEVTGSPVGTAAVDKYIVVCGACDAAMDDPKEAETHWHCLHDSMWSMVPAVQITVWRLLTSLSGSGWADALVGQMYLDQDTLDWAQGTTVMEPEAPALPVDSNGTELQAGDAVTLIKDLTVKGAGFTAKRGTLVKNIRLTDNPAHIEGKCGGTDIVLVTAYLKKVI